LCDVDFTLMLYLYWSGEKKKMKRDSLTWGKVQYTP